MTIVICKRRRRLIVVLTVERSVLIVISLSFERAYAVPFGLPIKSKGALDFVVLCLVHIVGAQVLQLIRQFILRDVCVTDR